MTQIVLYGTYLPYDVSPSIYTIFLSLVSFFSNMAATVTESTKRLSGNWRATCENKVKCVLP